MHYAYIVVYCIIISACYYPILTKIYTCRLISVKIRDMKFHEDPSTGSCAVLCGRSDGSNKANGRFLELLC